MKGPGSRLKSISGGAQGAAAAAAAGAAGAGDAGDSAPLHEFMHPQFRRGRRDLLVGIKRHKDSGRVKRKRGVVSQRTIDIERKGGC